MGKLKSIFILLGVVVIGVIFFGNGKYVSADIESRQQVAQILQRHGINNPSEKDISVYQAGINAGMTDTQAMSNVRQLANRPIRGSLWFRTKTTDGSWHYDTAGATGRLIFVPNENTTLLPPGQHETAESIFGKLNNTGQNHTTNNDRIGNNPDSNSQDISEPSPLSVDDSQDNPTNQPSNQTPGQSTTGQQASGQTGSNQQSTPNQTANSGTTASNGNVAGSGNANTTTSCGEEGLAGQRFLFFRGPLVPCGVNKHCAGNNNLSIDKPCTLCHFFVLIQNFFNFLLSLLIVVSIFMLTIAGVLYIVSAGGKMATIAKEIIQKTLLGFTLFLLSWLIIFTLLKLLAVNTSMLGTGSSWFQFTCDDESAFWVEPDNVGGGSGGNNVNGGGGGNNTAGGNGEDNTAGGSEEHTQESSPSVTATNANEREQAYRNMLRNAGIRINHNNHCTSPNESGCTTLVGAREYTLNKIMQLKADDCPNCDIQVNAVTDKWIDSNGVAHTNQEAHSTNSPYSHDNGYKVDYLATPSLNRHLTGVSNVSQLSSIPDGQTNGVLTRAGSRGGEYGGPRFYDNEGNEWVYETSKGIWDVKYDQGASRH